MIAAIAAAIEAAIIAITVTIRRTRTAYHARHSATPKDSK